MSNWKFSIRIRKANPNHHLVNNHATWWWHFWALKDGLEQKRFRVNLHTQLHEKALKLRVVILGNGWKQVIRNGVEGGQRA